MLLLLQRQHNPVALQGEVHFEVKVVAASMQYCKATPGVGVGVCVYLYVHSILCSSWFLGPVTDQCQDCGHHGCVGLPVERPEVCMN